MTERQKSWTYKGIDIYPAERNSSGIRWYSRNPHLRADTKAGMRQLINESFQERLEHLRGELQAERISYAEIAELQGLKREIQPGDVELLEAAGVPE